MSMVLVSRDNVNCFRRMKENRVFWKSYEEKEKETTRDDIRGII